MSEVAWNRQEHEQLEAVGDRLGAVDGERMQEREWHLFSHNSHPFAPWAVPTPSLYKYKALGLEEMDTRLREKEKEKEKEMAPGERKPKDLTWIVVKLRNREDSGHGKMCGVWVDYVRNELMIAYCAN
ncbi:hypothetical protein F2Q68_00010329 [Brassica cretica]|uniref:Uncharacterized protein n=1 Tax=Brassica cretica TaxID=69181 RepID=A0A8S9KY23_BRACR|nr:hypothetical protein F2Q68_00010329 [Brassica cretica]